jgi:hypothetical protein
MALISALHAAVRFVHSCVDRGHVAARRAAAAAVSTMSAIGRHCSNTQGRVISEPQAESLAAAIEVEILLDSWRARHQPAEQTTRRHFGRCCSDR